MTPEAKFGIRKEPDITCPLIDGLINDITDRLEELRKENEAIRAWGDAWKSECLEVSEKFEDAIEKINSLESEVSDLRDKVSELQDKLDRLG